MTSLSRRSFIAASAASLSLPPLSSSPTSDGWEQYAPMPTPRYGLGGKRD
jgi:hypothetical protein